MPVILTRLVLFFYCLFVWLGTGCTSRQLICVKRIIHIETPCKRVAVQHDEKKAMDYPSCLERPKWGGMVKGQDKKPVQFTSGGGKKFLFE